MTTLDAILLTLAPKLRACIDKAAKRKPKSRKARKAR
jgi:hypothetical protein